eukprot:m.121874 g.121874  ORF g.121874 m.121874 type:complete len:635 (+) comp14586_c2_seq2:20-1924(+)
MAAQQFDPAFAPVFERYLEVHSRQYPVADPAPIRAKLHEIGRKFRDLDANSNGVLDLAEMRLVDPAETEKAVKDRMRAVDDDDSGTLRLQEFINYMLLKDHLIENPVEFELPNPRRIFHLPGRRQAAQKQVKRGQIELSLSLKKEKGDAYNLTARVIGARELLACDANGLSDPYVKLRIEGRGHHAKHDTKVKERSLEPRWDETFAWSLPADTDLAATRLVLTVKDHDRLKKDDIIGRTSFSLAEIAAEKQHGWFVLLDKSQGAVVNFPCRSTSEEASVLRPPSVLLPRAESNPDVHHKASDFHFLKLLSRGAISKTFLVESVKSKKNYMIKTVSKVAVTEESLLDEIKTEQEIFRLSEKCPLIAPLLASFQDGGTLFYVFPFYQGGDLLQHSMARSALMPAKEVAFYAAEIALGLSFLHSNGFLHRDLKLDNVLLDARGHVHLCDFGLATSLRARGIDRTDTCIGTPSKMAPEVMQGLPYSFEADWWSYGVLVFELAANSALFFAESDADLTRLVLTRKPVFPTEDLDPALCSLLSRLLERNQSKRLGYGKPEVTEEAIRADGFVRQFYDWAALRAGTIEPPFRPHIASATDVSNFDTVFTDEPAVLSPVPATALAAVRQDEFANFSFATVEL